MTTDPRGRRDGRPPLASAEELHEAITALGIKTGGVPMPRARALGALLFCVEMLHMFDVDRLDAAEVRAGYVNMALMAGMTMAGEEMTAGAVVPAREFTADLYEEASFAFGRMIEHRLNSTLLDLQEMAAPAEPGTVSIGSPITAWMQAICALTPLVNAGDAPNAEVLKAAKAAKKHAAEARQHLADLLKSAAR
ncbi:hypothetical protein [Kitasatospora sp. NBC_01302]|uniref:hypothetical protein n=1 Tax=Kitasatospora sp. NBC_01302 TaxID=2903575 RepID=UPI002E125D73|nr:hypothetical protein OG294_40875 [Kitasatospora sp. NBC_01302]